MFIIVDGIDGSGKGTIVNALAEARRAQGARVFDLREFAKKEHRLPDFAKASSGKPDSTELDGFDVIVSAEPTHAWIGAAIREEIIRTNDRNYSAIRTGEAYALDRLILYRRILLPARARGVDIIQERSVTSSLAYQTIQAEPLTLETIAALEGNDFCLKNPPDLCIIVSTEPARAMQRLQLRTAKQDEAIFERLPILEKLHEQYHNDAFRRTLEHYGWPLAYLDANGAVEDAVAEARRLWETATHKISNDKFLISNQIPITNPQ